MKTIVMDNGQIFEVLESLKEVKSFVDDNYMNNKDFLDDDSSLYVEYKDGSHYYISGVYECGTFKKTGIKAMIECNSATWTVYGSWMMIKTDTKDSDYDCVWLAEVA